MGKWISAMLLASAMAVPALAQPPQGDRHDHGEDRGGQHENGGQRESSQRETSRQDGGGRQGGEQVRPGNQGGGEVVRPQAQVQQQARPMTRPDWQRAGGQQGWHGNGQPGGGAAQAWQGDRGRPDSHAQNWQGGHARADWHEQRDASRDWRGGDHRGWDGDHGRVGWNGQHGGDWNRGWRQDRRYDWQGWRNEHRDYYRVDRYRVPYGWNYGYRRFSLGYRLPSFFFAEQYWITNPDYYRLPPADESYRWIRYYNDALLINVYDGSIVDEIPDFFHY